MSTKRDKIETMLTLYNSLSKQKETFVPANPKAITLYVCGITPYDTTHLGHAFTYISFDSLVRYLEYKHTSVIYTQNVTDINDRDNDILKRAKEQNVSWTELSSFWTNKFLTDMQSLNWVKPTNYLFASKQIPVMTSLIERIIAHGQGYVVNNAVYLDIEKVQDFGKLSKLSKEQMLLRAKEFDEDIANKDKRHPLDITLWRPTQQNQPIHIPSFDSPWGKGRPGWHLECSAMSISSLGQQIDIHGGGIDLIYPHHESEIAQSESATGKIPFAKYWLHTGTVGINGTKMSKSLGNLILISDLLKKYSANAIRWVLLSHHYRSNWEYDESEFITAEKTIKSVQDYLSINATEPKQQRNLIEEAEKFLDNDLQAGKVLEIIQKATIEGKEQNEVKKLLIILGFVL